jgi:phosphoadenosine phosphosulfate reductase
MLIQSARHTALDLEHWNISEECDRVLALTDRMSRFEDDALEALSAFARDPRPFYVGVSWGKDSVVVAHLAWRLRLDAPVAWFPAGRIENPDCALVRDAFIRRFPVNYREIEAAPSGEIGGPLGHDGAQDEFERVSATVAERYVSGVRAAESGSRKMRMRIWGASSKNTCAPFGWWPTDILFAYLAKHDLPVHPIYACTAGGLYDRLRLRVGTVGGGRGMGHGRREHERRYYPELFREVPEMLR